MLGPCVNKKMQPPLNCSPSWQLNCKFVLIYYLRLEMLYLEVP